MSINKNNNQETKVQKHSTKDYKKILNNLLNISINDSCLFSNINNKNSFDVAKKFGNVFFDKIIINEFFLISLTETDIRDFIKKINESENLLDIRGVYKSFNEDVPDAVGKMLVAKTSDSKIESIKKEIIKSAELKKQKSSFN